MEKRIESVIMRNIVGATPNEAAVCNDDNDTYIHTFICNSLHCICDPIWEKQA